MTLGRKGGKATAEKRCAAERSAAACKAVEARWAGLRKLAAEIDSGTKALLDKSHAAARAKKSRARKL